MEFATHIENHRIVPARQCSTSHYDDRPDPDDLNLLVIHNISLPPGEFGSSDVEDFFCGNLSKEKHPFFEAIAKLRVSAHLFIRRDGEVLQFVPFDRRAWHAGVSEFDGRTACNNFSIGIELEGTDTRPYSDSQYQQLAVVTRLLMTRYPNITAERIVGHCDIAPDRKTDPGSSFDWQYYRSLITSPPNATTN